MNKQELIKAIQQAVILNNGMIQCPKETFEPMCYASGRISYIEYLNVEYILDCLYEDNIEIDTMIYRYDILDIEILTKIYNYIKSMNKDQSSENKPPTSNE